MWLLLKADKVDQRNWLDLFPAPFNPVVEILIQDGQEYLVLKGAQLGGTSTPREAYEAGKLTVREMNGVVAGVVGKSRVTVSGTIRPFGGRFSINHVSELETAHIRFGAGVAKFQVLDEQGRPIIEPPAPSIAQKRCKAAAAKPLLAEALAYSAGDPDWFDLYKVCECLIAAGVKLDKHMQEVKQTANSYRHRPSSRSPAASNPPSLFKATRLTRACINKHLDQ